PCSMCFFQAEDGIRARNVTGVQTCALPILPISVPRSRLTINPLSIQMVDLMPSGISSSSKFSLALPIDSSKFSMTLSASCSTPLSEGDVIATPYCCRINCSLIILCRRLSVSALSKILSRMFLICFSDNFISTFSALISSSFTLTFSFSFILSLIIYYYCFFFLFVFFYFLISHFYLFYFNFFLCMFFFSFCNYYLLLFDILFFLVCFNAYRYFLFLFWIKPIMCLGC